jgi:hypothetical protein
LLGRGSHSCLLWPTCLFSLCEGLPLPHSPELREPHPLCCMSFFFSAACLLFSFFPFFPWVGVILSRGLCWFVPGSTAFLLICSPGGLPSRVGAGVWQHGSPPGFSV